MEINFSKYSDGLVPAIVQDDITSKVLMLGFMNQEALARTRDLGKVTFYSRSKKRLWTKGEESGHFLILKEILVDCDQDSLLIKATPQGAVCHTGADTCWSEKNETEGLGFLNTLQSIIQDRKSRPQENSYISGLFKKGINKIAQKVGWVGEVGQCQRKQRLGDARGWTAGCIASPEVGQFRTGSASVQSSNPCPGHPNLQVAATPVQTLCGIP